MFGKFDLESCSSQTLGRQVSEQAPDLRAKKPDGCSFPPVSTSLGVLPEGECWVRLRLSLPVGLDSGPEAEGVHGSFRAWAQTLRCSSASGCFSVGNSRVLPAGWHFSFMDFFSLVRIISLLIVCT